MEMNVGALDRFGRVGLALIIVLAFSRGILKGKARYLLMFSGALLMSAVTGYCPMYEPLGINTCKPAD